MSSRNNFGINHVPAEILYDIVNNAHFLSKLDKGISVEGCPGQNGEVTIKSMLEVTGDIIGREDLIIDGNTTLGMHHCDKTEIVGHLCVCGNSVFNGCTCFNGDVNICGNLDVKGDATICGDLIICSDLVVDSNLCINGDTKLGNDSSDTTIISGTLCVNGDTKLGNDSSDLTVISGTLEVMGDLIVSSDTTLNNLCVTGDTKLGIDGSDTTTVNGDLCINGFTKILPFEPSDGVSCSDPLLTIHGSVGIVYDLCVGGTVVIESPLSPTDCESEEAALTVEGGAIIKQNLVVCGDLLVEGDQTIIESIVVTVGDNLIVLNDPPAAGPHDGGLFVHRFQDENDVGSGQVVCDKPFECIDVGAVGNTLGTIHLSGAASSADDFYNGVYLKVISGTPAINNNVRRITDYDGTTKIATVTLDFGAVPSVGDTVKLYGRHYVGFFYDGSDKKWALAGIPNDPPMGEVGIRDYLDLKLDTVCADSIMVSSDALIGGKLTVSDSVCIGGDISIDGDGIIEGELVVGDKLTVSDNVCIGGDIDIDGTGFVEGDFTVGSKLFVSDSLCIGGDAIIDGGLTVGDKLFTSDDACISGELIVCGDALFKGDVIVSSDLTVGGTITFDGKIIGNDGLCIDGDTFLNDELTVGGKIFASDGLCVADDVDIGGNVIINGELVVADKLFASDDMCVGGDTFLDGKLTVGGKLFASDGLCVAGDVDIDGTLTIGDKLFASDDICVGGDILLDGELTVGDKLFASDDICVGGDILLDGELTVGGKLFASDDVCVGGDTLLDGELTVGGKLFASDDVCVGGDTLLDGELTVGGKLFASDDVCVGGDFDVDGIITINNLTAASPCSSDAGGALIVSGGLWVGMNLSVVSDADICGDTQTRDFHLLNDQVHIGNGTDIQSLGVADPGTKSIAIGCMAQASGDRSIAIGISTTSEMNGIAIGEFSSAGSNTFVAGGDGPATAIKDVYFGTGTNTTSGDGEDYTIHGSIGSSDVGMHTGGDVCIVGGEGKNGGVGGDVLIGWDCTDSTDHNGDVGVGGLANNDYKLTVNGNTLINDLTSAGPCESSDGALVVLGGVWIGDNITVVGNAEFCSDITVNGKLFASDNVCVGGDIFVDNNAVIGGKLFASDDVCVGGNVDINGNVIIEGDLVVNGKLFASDNLCVAGDLHVDGNVTVASDVTIDGELTVNGGATICGEDIIICASDQICIDAVTEVKINSLTVTIAASDTFIQGTNVCVSGDTIKVSASDVNINGNKITITASDSICMNGPIFMCNGDSCKYLAIKDFLYTEGNTEPILRIGLPTGAMAYGSLKIVTHVDSGTLFSTDADNGAVVESCIWVMKGSGGSIYPAAANIVSDVKYRNVLDDEPSINNIITAAESGSSIKFYMKRLHGIGLTDKRRATICIDLMLSRTTDVELLC